MDARNWQDGQAPMQRRISLRLKAYLTYGTLLAFAILLAIFVFYQKNLLLREFGTLQAAYARELQLHEMEARLLGEIESHVLNTDNLRNPGGREHLQRHLQRYQEMLQREIRPLFPGAAAAQELETALQAAAADPSPERLARFAAAQSRFLAELRAALGRSAEHRQQLVENYRERSNRAALIALSLGLGVLTFLGLITRLFFRRLSQDLHMLTHTSMAVARGEREVELPVERTDEVGELARVICRLARDLRQQEHDLEIERQKTFHQEKMASIGRLAAGIAHEVGNPIAAISGLVKDIIEARETGQCPLLEPEDECKLRMVLEHVQRLSHITHQISEIAQPQSSDSSLVDLNGLVRSTTNLMRYDERWKNIALRLDLDKRLPAINAVSDQITQVIMNLLVNAADALESAQPRAPCVCIKTGRVHDHVFFVVEDNGEGMSSDVLAKAKQAFFTTKRTGKGTGQGLTLCNAIVEAHGGRMEIHSTPGKGTRVFVYLPVERALLEEGEA